VDRRSRKIYNLLMVKRNKGFTLIEIVLVMAIAGLIIILIFAGLIGAQKSRRDAVRKRDLQRLGSQVETFASNHEGKYPTADSDPQTGFTGGFAATYTPANFIDPFTDTSYAMNTGISGACDPTAAMGSNGPGSISYEVPGASGPYHLRMCLEQGQYDIGN
jgi:prepilin-type N-terminal cleavage/methylation domain-containing protein